MTDVHNDNAYFILCNSRWDIVDRRLVVDAPIFHISYLMHRIAIASQRRLLTHIRPHYHDSIVVYYSAERCYASKHSFFATQARLFSTPPSPQPPQTTEANVTQSPTTPGSD